VKALSPDEMLAKLRKAVETAGSQRAYASAIGVSEQYLCDCLKGRRDIGKSIAGPLGYHPTTIYIPIES
jgi:DNA-binding transcriptional regulator YdaS (Cro superfamily)